MSRTRYCVRLLPPMTWAPRTSVAIRPTGGLYFDEVPLMNHSLEAYIHVLSRQCELPNPHNFKSLLKMSDTSGDGVKAVSAVFAVLTAIAVALRFWARRRQKAPLLADDWLMVPTLVIQKRFIFLAAIANRTQSLANIFSSLHTSVLQQHSS